MHNLHTKQQKEYHIYSFYIVWQQFWPVSGRQKPVKEMLTFLSLNVQDGCTSTLLFVYQRLLNRFSTDKKYLKILDS